MMVGDPPRSVIDVETIIEVAFLGLAAQLGQLKALTRCLAATSRKRPRLQDCDVVAALRQFIGCRHARDPGSQHDDFLSSATGKVRRSGLRGRNPKAQSAHTRHQQGGPADTTQTLKKTPARNSAHTCKIHHH